MRLCILSEGAREETCLLWASRPDKRFALTFQLLEGLTY